MASSKLSDCINYDLCCVRGVNGACAVRYTFTAHPVSSKNRIRHSTNCSCFVRFIILRSIYSPPSIFQVKSNECSPSSLALRSGERVAAGRVRASRRQNPLRPAARSRIHCATNDTKRKKRQRFSLTPRFSGLATAGVEPQLDLMPSVPRPEGPMEISQPRSGWSGRELKSVLPPSRRLVAP